ncbi:hypothetical protein P175DRAFT_0508565 [Aspergillus ochraceoroseus IBT 24754]|uniref:Protein kinase domain-containing protein n=3 Tax=Aspergillus subgen. Nidulantes TaxID=2720870 RepID=A0A0F8UVB5_9EURO|nr:uncharacterized protein P175DRAFT_0508565 [Aspergillus ochraceoroseus IBT 24754]KKK18214.1 hypothetical protein AOCH_001929 [Aspergillus ochraceoroseus]KKK23469.1 hypothetical protein ARAM_003973 [Aspergillus rambellii]PTU21619.1 hypothetical protein P175DRAFT_0508565 [Aspergillus ochraceoroseus IBT 24754]
MSLQELNELRQLLKEEQRRREEEQQLLKKEQQLLKKERRRREQAEDELKLQTQNTTLLEFLDGCHTHLFLGLTVQQDKNSTTKGDPANADHKVRPTKIREWTNFPTEQISIWNDLMSAEFATERHFTPLLALKEYGKEARGRMVGSEIDLSYFERQTIESRVASVIKQLHASPQLRQTFRLNGDVTFENHANTLTDESNITADMSSLSLTQGQPRRSDRLAAKSSNVSLPPRQPQRATQPRRPRADQFCVYNKGPNGKVPAYIIEYKAPHKVSLAHIKTGLEDMDLDEVLRFQEKESSEDICRRVVAAVITQTFSYMIHGGLEYGYVCTGEAFIFLRVLHDDPSTVYYYLSVPEEDVGTTTGWTGNPRDGNRLHLTALGQVLAFTLRAVRVPTRDTAWTQWAVRNLETWVMVYDELLDKIAEKDIPSSAFKSPTSSRNAYCRATPVKTRSKSTAASCNPSQSLASPAHDDDHDDDSGDRCDPDTPSRPPRESRIPHPPVSSSTSTESSRGKSREYCTQLCLRGLSTGSKLDQNCPNVLDHGVDQHQLTPRTLIHELALQLSSDDIDLNTVLGCESLHIHGSRGALFKITVWSHGYTFVGKGVPVEFVQGSKHEERIYSQLAPIQGVYVPVLLGSLKLRRPFSYDGIADIVHLMLMGYAGKTLAGLDDLRRCEFIGRAEEALRAIHELRVLQGDPICGNMVEKNGRVMFIDFERATYRKSQIESVPMQTKRLALGPVSPNKKRKPSSFKGDPVTQLDCFGREMRRMKHGL